MIKRKNELLNTLAILTLNIAFWICNLYPRHILEFDSVGSIVSVLINLIFFTVFDYILILAFSENKSLFSSNILKKEYLSKLAVLLVIQLFIDAISCLFGALELEWQYLIKDVLVAVQWIVSYFVITYRKDNVFKKRNILTISTLIVAVVLGASLFLNNAILLEYSEFALKYEAPSAILAMAKSNAEFIYSAKLLLLDSILGVTLIIAHGLASSSCNKERCGKTLLRAFVLIISFLILVISKINFWPYSAIVQINAGDGEHIHYASGKFNSNISSFEIYRFSIDCKKELVYSDYNITLERDGLELVNADSIFANDMYSEVIEELSINEEKVFIHNSQYICYYEKGVPCAINLNVLSDYTQNDTVIETCKQLLENGNIYIFEYCKNYLLKYDKSFIDGYIERYSNGEFSKTESEWLETNCYKSEFVTNFAKSK